MPSRAHGAGGRGRRLRSRGRDARQTLRGIARVQPLWRRADPARPRPGALPAGADLRIPGRALPAPAADAGGSALAGSAAAGVRTHRARVAAADRNHPGRRPPGRTRAQALARRIDGRVAAVQGFQVLPQPGNEPGRLPGRAGDLAAADARRAAATRRQADRGLRRAHLPWSGVRAQPDAGRAEPPRSGGLKPAKRDPDPGDRVAQSRCTLMAENPPAMTSNRPYLLRAIYD